MTDPRLDPAKRLPLSSLEFHILLALAKGKRHGYAVLQDVRERSEGRVHPSASTLYDTIARLESGRLIREVPGEAQATGRKRRYYELTPFGQAVGAAERERLAKLVEGVGPGLFDAGTSEA